MRIPRPTSATATLALAILAAACVDAPSTPVAAPTPRASRDVSMQPISTAPYDIVENGVTFAKIQLMPGSWMETFNLNAFPEVKPTWDVSPTFWTPATGSSTDPFAWNYTTVGAPDRAANSLPDWAIVRQVRDQSLWYTMEPMSAWHGMNCIAPPATHIVASYDEAPFLCRNHMMTAVNAGTATGDSYAVTYLTPNRLVDFSTGADVVVRFDMTTLRHSMQDWTDLWITPYDDNLVVPLDDSLPDVQGHPKRGLHVRMTAGQPDASRYQVSVITGHQATLIPPSSTETYEEAFARTPDPGVIQVDAIPPTNPLHTSATRRDTFELRIAGGRLKFGMPRYNLWWYDVALTSLDMGPRGLGVLQLGHHSFHPTTGGGAPNTWHWDNIGIAPARRFTIINAVQRYVDAATHSWVDFARPAPADAYLRFAAYGDVEVKFEQGGWQDAARQAEELNAPGRFHSYWIPVPAGTTRVFFNVKGGQSKKNGDPWLVRDITIWSLN